MFDDPVNEFLEIARDYDGFIIGSPVHWGGAGGAITSLDIYPPRFEGVYVLHKVPECHCIC